MAGYPGETKVMQRAMPRHPGAGEGSVQVTGALDPLAPVRDLLHAWAVVAAAGDGGRCPLVHPVRGSRGRGSGGPMRPMACPLWPALEHELACALLEARRRGWLTTREDGVTLARFLLAAMQGLAVIGRVHPDADHLRTIADDVLAALDRALPAPS